jgi:hypothetical protein
MAEVRVYITVKENYHGKEHLLETTFDMDFLPSVGDRIHPCKNDEDSGLSFEVYRRYWDEHGKAVLELPVQIIDPDESLGAVPSRWQTWWTDRDGSLVEILLANGWWHYGRKEKNGD